MYLKTLYFLLIEGWKKQLFVQWAPRIPQRKEKVSFRKAACCPSAVPLPGLLPGEAAQIHPNMTVTSAWETWQKVNAVLRGSGLSQAPMWVSAPSLSCGMGYVQFLSLSYLLPGAVLSLQILPVNGYSSGCYGDKAISLLVGFTENKNQLANSIDWSLVLNPRSFLEQETFEQEVCLSY